MIISAGLVAIAAGLVGYAMVTELWQLVVIYCLMAAGLSACGLVSNMLILSRWFVSLRGRATGILLMSSSAGGVVFPLVLGTLIATGGWRSAMQILAGIVIVIALLPMLTIVRDRPRKPEPAASAAKEAPGLRGPTVKEALTDKRFYLIAIATGAVWFTLIGMTQHQSIYLAKDMGFSTSLLPTVFSTFFAMSVAGKLIFGWLSDHFDKLLMMVLSIALLAVSLLLLRFVDYAGNITLYGYAAIGGIGFSGSFTMIQLMFANFYAGDSFGKILAILMLVDTLSGAAGTRIIALMRESSGSYLSAIDLMMGLLIVAATCVLLARPRGSSNG
jgi:sugar phosphate permease